MAKPLTIFVENRPGRLRSISENLGRAHIGKPQMIKAA
jgi:hypothetical protein